MLSSSTIVLHEKPSFCEAKETQFIIQNTPKFKRETENEDKIVSPLKIMDGNGVGEQNKDENRK